MLFFTDYDYFSKDNYSIEFQSILEKGTSLINQLLDRLRQLNVLVETYGDSLTGNEENVLNLVAEVKELWKNLTALFDSMHGYYSVISEEQKQEAYKMYGATVRDLKEDLFATLFNAKYIHIQIII